MDVKQPFIFQATMLLNSKILIVDDDRMNRLVATTILKKYGAVVCEVVNGAEALKALVDMDIDLVLMDIQMPVMDGIKTVSIIRQKVSRSLPVIALTASVIKGDKKKYLEAGMNDYLRKPFKEKVLMDMMALWLNKSKRPLLKNEPTHVSTTAQLYNLSNIKMIGFGNDGFVAKMVKIFV
ncbi:MAG: response regulator, partial [Pedobacter sp.]|nr:response regulator [Pedobacter sp.]